MEAFTERLDTPDPTGSSKPLFSGTPAIAVEIEEWAEEFEKNMVDILDEVIAAAEHRLKTAAYNDNEWSRHADILSVSVHNDEVVYGHKGTPEEDQQIFDIEFGKEEIGPNSLLRKFAEQDIKIVNKELNKAIMENFGHV